MESYLRAHSFPQAHTCQGEHEKLSSVEQPSHSNLRLNGTCNRDRVFLVVLLRNLNFDIFPCVIELVRLVELYALRRSPVMQVRSHFAAAEALRQHKLLYASRQLCTKLEP